MVPQGPDYLSGGSFGVEGSIITSIVLIIGSLYLTYTIRKGAQQLEAN